MKKWIIILTVLLVLVGAGAAAFYILSQPPKESLSDEFKEEAVTRLLGRKAQLEAKDVPQGNTLYEGKHISFQYPAKALIYTYRNNASTSAKLEDFSFDIKSPKLVFNMTVVEKSGTLDDVPAVRLRDQRSYEYVKAEAVAEGVSGVSYFKAGREPEKSGFFLTDGKLFTVSVTGVNDEEVGKLFDEVVSTVSFSSGQ